MNERSYSLTPRTIAGLLLSLLGVVLLLDNFDYLDASGIIRFWPALLIVFGALKASKPGNTSGRVFGAVIALIGVVMVLNRADIIDISIGSLWPLVLVLIGLSFVLRGKPAFRNVADSGADHVSGSAILGAMTQRVTSARFTGGSVTAVLGGQDINLRDADIPENGEAVLDVFVLLGGIDILIPDGWTVVVETSAILGGVEQHTRSNADPRRVLRITGTVVLGGVELKH